MNDVDLILSAVEHGDPTAAEQLLPLVYEELRRLAAQRLAREKPGQTLQATALVHEAYLRLVGPQDPGWDGRGHFFAAAAEAMRRILVERARRKRRRKHGGGRSRQDSTLDEDLAEPETRDPLEVLAVHDSLDRLRKRRVARPNSEAAVLLWVHDGRSGPGAGHRPGDGRRGLDLLQGMAAPALAQGRGEKEAPG